jgi:hypothetical protein
MHQARPEPRHLRRRYVTEKDLAFFQYHVEQEGEVAGASGWDLMLDKHINGQLKYQAWRRTLPVISLHNSYRRRVVPAAGIAHAGRRAFKPVHRRVRPCADRRAARPSTRA